jgi:hypothetical protein
MLKLLDSIYKGYPIGSILIWNSSQKLTSERTISGLDVNTEESTYYPTNYLLDGQQRLTTLCGALFWDGGQERSIWNIHFDLEEEAFVHPQEPNLVNLFPLNRLIKTSDFIRQCMKFEHHESAKKYFEKAERLLKSIKDYKIAVVKIGDMTIDEVAPIFERINSTGRKLTIVDLMMAATWSDGFDLSKEIANVGDRCEGLGFSDITGQVVLRSISAAAGFGINKEDIQRLRAKDAGGLKDAANAAGDAFERALTFLSLRLNIRDFSYIPYGMQLTHLVEFFRLCQEPEEEMLRELERWFWFTSVTRYFGGASTGQNSKDLKVIRDFARGAIDKMFGEDIVDISHLIFDNFNLKNAASTTFTLLLTHLSPGFTLDGKSIDGIYLKSKSSKYFSSFSPRDGVLEKMNISRVINPYPDEVNLGDVSAELLESHLLNSVCVDAITSNDADGYIRARAKIISDKLVLLTGCRVKFMHPSGGEAFDSEAYEGDGSIIE